jgi:prepilin-type N-terminal cleavage/methylation domain-containing protein
VHKIRQNEKGFTFLEILTVLIIMGIMAAIAIGRTVNYDAEVYAGADTLKSHLRYAQTSAMNSNPDADGTAPIWGIKGSVGSYWLFKGTNPDSIDNIYRLAEEDSFVGADKKIDLAAKKIKLSFTGNFTIFFDDRGIPYTSYTSATDNTPLTANMRINVKPLSADTPSIPVDITPFTGYVP